MRPFGEITDGHAWFETDNDSLLAVVQGHIVIITSAEREMNPGPLLAVLQQNRIDAFRPAPGAP